MRTAHRRRLRLPVRIAALSALVLAVIFLPGCGDGPALEPWHTEKLTEEFTADMAEGKVRTFEGYLELEERLFGQLDALIRSQTPTGPEHALVRFSRARSISVRSAPPRATNR